MARFFRLAILWAAGVAIALTLLAALGVWLIAGPKVARLRAIAARSAPVAPLVRDAILAAEDPLFLERPRLSLRAFVPLSSRMRACAPTLAYQLVCSMTPRRRALWWSLETTVSTYVVTRVFEPEELLRIYAHELYMGHNVMGVEAASAVYFAKASGDLTPAQAATIAAMIRSPNFYSPVKYPERVLPRRNFVLERMRTLGFIDERAFRAAIQEPLGAAPSASGNAFTL
jgi:penicillin-binding protein 1A